VQDSEGEYVTGEFVGGADVGWDLCVAL
jgi:hypothetical protein